MDENKRLKLIEIEYEVKACCGTCMHSKFRTNNDFGDCQIYAYRHLKHSTDVKDLSIFRYGTCPSHEFEQKSLDFMHAFKEFL